MAAPDKAPPRLDVIDEFMASKSTHQLQVILATHEMADSVRRRMVSEIHRRADG